ncbi:MAG: hypothetical protein AB1502_06270 [Thermodesulfobacteriota bacterium]
MSIKKGCDRISLVLAIMAIPIPFLIWINAGEHKEDLHIAFIFIPIAFCVVLFGLRGITRLVLWIIEGFK